MKINFSAVWGKRFWRATMLIKYWPIPKNWPNN